MGPMLTPGIRDAYRAAVDSLISHGARAIASGAGDDPARPMLLSAPASALLKDAELAEECFGPCSCVFLADSPKTLLAVLGKLGGQLTGTIFATDGDLAKCPELVPAVSRKVGRVVFNAVPTGVPVCYQSLPPALQPAELRNENPLGIMRIVNSVRSREPLELDSSKKRRTA